MDLPDPSWTERALSTGVILSVDRLTTLRISDGASFMLTLGVQDVWQVTLDPRLAGFNDTASHPASAFPWNVDLAYRGAHFAFICSTEDLRAVRYIFAGVAMVDAGARMGLPPAR